MPLTVYNTASRKAEEFKPLKQGVIGIYVCGMTVYDDMHIGHARTYLAFDTIIRYLKYRGFSVKYVQNITDIDDKIIDKARELGITSRELSKEYSAKSLADQAELGILPADEYPKVSGHIPEIIRGVEALIGKGHAYEVEGDVYFEVSTLTGYGGLSNQQAGVGENHSRVSDDKKRDNADFALWKKASQDEPGYESPWGRGRPGWHIECSLMSRKYLGDAFDIHGGALDLVFPHHENERAQGKALTGREPVKYWMHTGFLYSRGEKMSKSLGNILSVREFLESHSADALRLFFLQSHYRSQIDYNPQLVEASEKSVKRLTDFRKRIGITASGHVENHEYSRLCTSAISEFKSQMDDDFNTPKAVAVLFSLVRHVNRLLDEGHQQVPECVPETFSEITGVLGLRLRDDGVKLTGEQEKLVKERIRYRAKKNYGEADRIRDILEGQGIRVIDENNGSYRIEKV